MSKRMVTYSVSDDDKIASIDGHELGSGGVGDKSISRRMITYEVDDAGKIASIDGHELNGGGGGDYQIKELVVTENGVYDVAGEAYKPVRVNVPQTAQSGTLKAFLDAKQTATSLFADYKGTSVDDLISYNDTANVYLMNKMFSGCNNLTTIPRLDTSKVTNMSAMFEVCNKLTTIPKFNTSNVTNMTQLFRLCEGLTSVPELDVRKCKYFHNTFYKCTSLKSIGLYGFTSSIDISDTALGHDALVAFLNQAGTASDGSTITMGSAKLALLSEEEKAIATNKGWTLA